MAEQPWRLTRWADCAGCAAKLDVGSLARALEALGPVRDPRLLVGPATCDDAGVYQLTDDLALVQTVDFFPPVVDEPADFGRIAAANALSDIYAMGARPLTALNLVAFPAGELPAEVLHAILRAAAAVLEAAGVALVGGHT
ncbi:MAG: selenide, water dikinase SelD, partial [Gammaproteobacteria bacterium]|nr:selenide, water dikinase SelD [Gammaproteobacteria bacterium]NIR99017.1 selenide, water dikinase SelD [Gammaproteobacteria bacterium]NIT64643.1 selenide, water dikinase SelD [Gammaproteobacteria bacterium]NIV21616.1 selenide, water dikinase SelD [Gammaproteobacteria bacterium]NIY33223.1 selenide, water dikinase SelD [Gammaproteobacteria bacterium]